MIEESRQYHPDDLGMISFATETNDSEDACTKITKNIFREKSVYKNIFEERAHHRTLNPRQP